MVVKNWIRIEIGYESLEEEDCDHQPDMQPILERYLLAEDRLRWALGGATDLGASTAKGDNWVKDVLDIELNTALQKSGHPPLKIGGRCQLFPEMARRAMSRPSGKPGTRCKMHGDRWVNSRSYELVRSNDESWPDDRRPEDAKVFATVHWICWPKDGPLLTKPKKLGAPKRLAAASGTARSKGASRRGKD